MGWELTGFIQAPCTGRDGVWEFDLLSLVVVSHRIGVKVERLRLRFTLPAR